MSKLQVSSSSSLFLALGALLLLFGAVDAQAASDPTLYEYYTSGGIKSGLSAASDQFSLNGKHYAIYGGSFHYFRVVPEYWRPVLARFKAAGLNAVEFYLPWNLHEPTPGKFDFTSPMLDLDHFLTEIKAADMFAIVRPGPYICAEWEFGGFPAWLLHDTKMQFRTNYQPYLDRVKLFWNEALKIINKHQFSTSGGPVIALQIENEYSGYITHPAGDDYLHALQKIVTDSGYTQLLFQSDPGSKAVLYPIKGLFAGDSVLQTANLNRNAATQLATLKTHQPGKPLFVSEFWPGWFDAWHDAAHHTYSVTIFDQEVTDAMVKMNGSVNFYMFIGGTNFGFMNGNRVVTSYDYDAPLSESGNYTAKYHKTRELYQKFVTAGRLPKTHLPDVPAAPAAHAYGKVAVSQVIPLEQILAKVQHKFASLAKPVPMELLPIGKDYGQGYGFVLYRVEGKAAKSYEVTGHIHNRALLLVDGHEEVTTGDNPATFQHTFAPALSSSANHVYDLLVENLGRVNSGSKMTGERRGIVDDGEIHLDGAAVHNITAYALDFDQKWLVDSFAAEGSWAKFDATAATTPQGPALYRTQLTVTGAPADTFISLTGWTKGNVFVNGFNLGRYWNVGPQKTLYLPGPLLKQGANTIEVFELHKPGHELDFVDHPQL